METDLIINSSLQLHDLVLHSSVELLEVLHRAGFDLQLLQLAPGLHPADAALQVHDGLEGALVPAAGQPAADVLLNDHHLMLPQQLRRRTGATGEMITRARAHCKFRGAPYRLVLLPGHVSSENRLHGQSGRLFLPVALLLHAHPLVLLDDGGRPSASHQLDQAEDEKHLNTRTDFCKLNIKRRHHGVSDHLTSGPGILW